MSDYSQPSFYRFNEDSLLLVEFVIQRVSSARHILDLGAGSGIIGIEAANKLSPESLTLVELQKEFLPHIHLNSKMFLSPSVKVNVFIESFHLWKPSMKYDLILANPPYFLPDHGQRSKDHNRDMCRSFLVGGWGSLLSSISSSLSEEGRAFVVLKDSRTVLEEVKKMTGDLELLPTKKGELLFLELFRLKENRS